MARISFISSLFKSLKKINKANVDKVAKKDESRQECRPLSNVHMPPPPDERCGSDEEGESEDEELGDASENSEGSDASGLWIEKCSPLPGP